MHFSDLSLTTCFAHKTAAHWMFFVFRSFLRILETVVCEITGDQQFSDTQTILSVTNNHYMVKVAEITFLPHSEIWSEKQQNLFTMSVCFYAFSCCHIIG